MRRVVSVFSGPRELRCRLGGERRTPSAGIEHAPRRERLVSGEGRAALAAGSLLLLLTSCAHGSSHCRGPNLALGTAYEHCSIDGVPEAPNEAAIEVVVPEAIEVVSGGRATFTVELHNRSDGALTLSFDPTFTTLVMRGGRRVLVVMRPGTEAATTVAPIHRVVLEPGGVLVAPTGVHAWATVEREDAGAVDLPVPPGDYEAQVLLPWGWARTVPLRVTPRDAGFTDPGFPHGTPELDCRVASDCRVVAGGCAAQVVSAVTETAIADAHRTLAEAGLCAPEDGRLITARCVQSICSE